ncbi:MAG: BON domain-containing protein [Caldimonas sp.]
MNPNFRRSLISVSIAAIAAVGLLAGCEQKTTTRSDGTTATTTTTVTNPTPEATAAMKSAANEMKSDVKSAADKAGNVIEDGAITAKVKTALLADPDVKGLMIDVDTKDGIVTLKGTADKAANRDRAVSIAKDTGGVKSVEDQLVVKASS